MPPLSIRRVDMPKIEGTRAALESLTLCGTNLRWARLDAAHAAPLLYGARAARAHELAEKIADCEAFCNRLVFAVTGDLRADERK
jgi:hypothetical protein